MTNLLLSLFLSLSAHGAFALTPDEINTTTGESPAKTLSRLQLDKEAIGAQGMAFFKDIITDSPLYAQLLVLDSNDPVIARTVEYVGVFHEVHKLNEQLADLLKETRKTNQLLATIVSQNPPN